MEFDNDPFPRSLPHIDEPRILDSNMTDAQGDNGFDFTSNFFDSPSHNPYSPEQNAYAWNGSSFQTATKSAMAGPSFSDSPESSLPDSSSSDSSKNQHKRSPSLVSSGSGELGGHGDSLMMEDTVDPRGITIGADTVEDQVLGQASTTTDLDSSNRAMECHFDFESAASTPSPYSDTKLAYKSPSTIKSEKMPYRTVRNTGSSHGVGPYAGASKNSRETSPLSMMLINQGNWPTTDYTPPSSQIFSNQYINGAMLNGPYLIPDWSHNPTSGDLNGFGTGQSSLSQQPTMGTPYALPTPAGDLPSHRPYLHVQKLPEKSRVETQIPVRIALHPLPAGITKLHLPPYTISKSKLVAKPAPEKSPDMLELHVMLVSTSAMQDPLKRARAAAEAIRFKPQDSPKEDRRSSSGNSTPSDDDESKPLNGGPVQICKGCIERERKRAGRKKTKNKEEEEEWLKDEAKRTIVFNTQEVKEWQQAPPPKDGEPTRDFVQDGSVPKCPKDALIIDLPMRIACYCRHQEEKMGFQVIFTIKNHLDEVIAQTMTTTITITDDHKTHHLPGTMPPQNMVYPDNSHVPGAGVFPQAPTMTPGPASFRNAYSTTDLQGLQRHFNAQQISPFAVPQNQSQTTSATLTPKNLSRPASPSAPSGQHKRRKASGSGRMRNDLTMTKLETTAAPPAQNRNIPAFAPSYATPPQALPMSSMPSQYSTNPPTPSTTGSSFFPTHAQRSQSMENLQNYPVFSAPTSGLPSRVPSPTTAALNNGIPHAHAQMLTNSLRSVPGAVQPQRSPRIHELTPAESSKSGGIKVACFGSGFYPGLVVMFGEAQAITTTFWGETALQCLVPPALQAGTVAVTFKHDYEQIRRSPPNMQVLFRYVDDEEQQLKDHALALVNQKLNGNATTASESAQNIINQFALNSSRRGSSQGSSQQRQANNFKSALAGVMDLEAAILSCLDLVDLDDSPYQASLNAQGNNGQSMLHLSASLGYYRLTAGLLARGAHPDLGDNNGMSAMHMASLRGHTQIIRKLRSAGGDQNLRSLNGYTPADMATSQKVLDATDAFRHHRRSRSTGTTPILHLSRDSSVVSYRSPHSRVMSAGAGSYFEDVPDDGYLPRAHKSQPVTPAQAWTRSRRNSLNREEQYLNDQAQGDLAPTLFAWRDQISAQIQQLQQSVQWTLPNLQIPALPPIPNLPDYQTNPVVRRISSLVPQRNPTPPATGSAAVKEADYHWWELLTGAASSPPAYEEIYPENSQQATDDKKRSTLLAAGEALVDQKCVETFDQPQGPSSIMDTINLGSTPLTRQQRERLRTAHANKVKRLRSDRNLFFIWIPLLVLVLVMMLKDRVPQFIHAISQAIGYAQERFQYRVVEVV